jgi:cell division protein FtsL
LGFARRIFYPALFTLLYFIILVVAISFTMPSRERRLKENAKKVAKENKKFDIKFFNLVS